MSMDQVITHFNRKYNLTEYEITAGDPRVSDWPFMRSPDSVLLVTGLYLLVVKYGPSFMADKQPVRATGLMVIYNFFMVGLSLYMFFEFFACGYHNNYGLLCQPVDYSTTPMGYRFYAGGFNVLVHVFMYTYYALSAMGPQVQKYLWWKKYLTKLQMIQFLSVNTRCVLSLLVECRYPRWINVVATFYSSSLFMLFANFYRHSYIEAKKKKQDQKMSSSGSPASSVLGLKEMRMGASEREHAD